MTIDAAAAAAPTAQTTADAAEDRLPWRIKASWAVGAFGVAILMNGISALALFYFVSVIGIAAGAAGFLIFLSKIYDAVSDPIAGVMSDKSTSKMGRRRPFLLWGAVISALAFLMVFTIPFQGPFASPWSGQGLAASAYVLFALLVYTTGYSLFNVPYMAMPAEMTRGYHERSAIHGWRVMFAAVGGFLAQSMAGVVLQLMGKDWDAHAAVGAIGAALIFVAMVATFFGTRDAPQLARTEIATPWRQQVGSLLKNGPFLQILSIKLVQLVGVSASSAGLMFLIVKVLDLPLTVLPLIGGPMILAVLTCTPLLVWISKRIGKRGGYVISAVATGLVALSWVWAAPGEPYWALALRGFVNGIAFAGNVLFAMSMLTDAMELDYHRTGMRREGMYSALYSFVEKFASAFGPLAVGAALAFAGFNPQTPPAETNEAVRQAVLVGVAYIPAAMAIAACVILAFYRLDSHRLAAIRAGAAP
jgi:GPH family glycoside/pentoside/hexuronide:cation symporter